MLGAGSATKRVIARTKSEAIHCVCAPVERFLPPHPAGAPLGMTAAFKGRER
jgi:hypothetical protein